MVVQRTRIGAGCRAVLIRSTLDALNTGTVAPARNAHCVVRQPEAPYELYEIRMNALRDQIIHRICQVIR